LSHVADHADDRHLVLRIGRWIASRKLYADRIASLEVAVDEYLVDDRDRYRVREIPRVEIATLDDGGAHRGEEPLARDALARARRIGRVERLSVKLRQERALEPSAHRVPRHEPGAGDAANTSHGRQQVD